MEASGDVSLSLEECCCEGSCKAVIPRPLRVSELHLSAWVEEERVSSQSVIASRSVPDALRDTDSLGCNGGGVIPCHVRLHFWSVPQNGQDCAFSFWASASELFIFQLVSIESSCILALFGLTLVKCLY